jgi:hypothetical protein
MWRRLRAEVRRGGRRRAVLQIKNSTVREFLISSMKLDWKFFDNQATTGKK